MCGAVSGKSRQKQLLLSHLRRFRLHTVENIHEIFWRKWTFWSVGEDGGGGGDPYFLKSCLRLEPTSPLLVKVGQVCQLSNNFKFAHQHQENKHRFISLAPIWPYSIRLASLALICTSIRTTLTTASISRRPSPCFDDLKGATLAGCWRYQQ